jgi:hypothetical protein
MVGFIAGLISSRLLSRYTMFYHLECRAAHPETLTDNHCSFFVRLPSKKWRAQKRAQARLPRREPSPLIDGISEAKPDRFYDFLIDARD